VDAWSDENGAVARREAKEITSVLTNLFGLPAHMLIIHAAVVFIPLASVFAIGYALVPRLRRPIWWAVLALGVLAPVTGWAARLSGQTYRQYFVDHGASGDFLVKLNTHQSYGLPTAWWATGLGVAMLVMVLWVLPGARLIPGAGTGALASRPVQVVIAVVNVALAVVALYYVIRTGDTGARAVHSPIT
jgi:hypothetical protein